jgi:hypothetical protein
VIAALLHDTVEDVGVTKDELTQAFGADVAELVVELKDDNALPKAERKRLQIVNAPRKSVREVIKLADCNATRKRRASPKCRLQLSWYPFSIPEPLQVGQSRGPVNGWMSPYP